jgi:hypothetical protein
LKIDKIKVEMEFSQDIIVVGYEPGQRQDSFDIPPLTGPPKFIIHTDMASAQLFPTNDLQDYRRIEPEFTSLDYTAIMKDIDGQKRHEIEQFPIKYVYLYYFAILLGIYESI